MARVLVLDDDEATRESLCCLLADEGYTAHEAVSVQQAIETLRAAPAPMLLLFDYLMPGQTGLDLVCEAERAVPFLDRHAFVCITASPTRLPEFLTGWLAQRDAPIVAKPFDVDHLLDVIEREAVRLTAVTE